MKKLSYTKKMNIFFVITIVFNMAASFAHPVTPTIFTDLNLGSYMFGYALGIMLCVNFATSPFWGMMNTYISSRVTLLICCVGYGLGQIMFGLATQEWQFLVARSFAGAFTGGAFVSVMTYIINTCEDVQRRGTYLTINATIISVGSAFGYLIGGVLGGIETRLPIWIQGATLTACGISFLLLCDNDAKIPFKDINWKRVAIEANPFAAFLASRSFMTVTLAFLFLMCAFQNLAFTAFDQSFNYYIRDQFQFPSSYNGFIKGGMGFISLVANSTICMWLMKKTDIKKSTIAVFFLCATSMAFAISMESIVPFIAFNILLFAFNTISMPLLQSLVAERGKGEDRNLIMGFYNAMRSFGGIIGAFLSGMLYNIEAKFPFYLVAIGFAIGAFFSYIYYNRSKKEVSV